MKKNIVISIIILVSIFLIIIINKNNSNKVNNKYVCFSENVGTDTIITKDIIKECLTDKKLPIDVIVDIDKLLAENKSFKYIGETKLKNEFIYEDEIYDQALEKSFEIELTNSLIVPVHGASEIEFREMKLYIEDDKLYANDLRTDEIRIIFDNEEIDKIGKRPLPGGGGGFKLLILTKNKNVYLLDNELGYKSLFDIDYNIKKLDISDVINFKIVVNDVGSSLWGIDMNGNQILIDK